MTLIDFAPLYLFLARPDKSGVTDVSLHMALTLLVLKVWRHLNLLHTSRYKDVSGKLNPYDVVRVTYEWYDLLMCASTCHKDFIVTPVPQRSTSPEPQTCIELHRPID